MSLSHTLFTSLPQSKIHYIHYNISIAEKEFILTKELLNKENISYIVAILPQKNDFLKINGAIKDFPYTVLDYGEKHDTTMNTKLFDECISTFSKRGKHCRVLVVCNNGYQRSIPFIVYYLITLHSNEFPTIEKALKLILSVVDESNYTDVLALTIENVSTLLST